MKLLSSLILLLNFNLFNSLTFYSSLPSIGTEGVKNGPGFQPYGIVSFGTPPQNFTFLLDTGSSATFVSEKGCQYTGKGSGSQPKGPCLTKLFDSSLSSTFSSINGKFSYSFGSDTYKGIFGKDVMQMGNLLLPNYTFALTNKVNIAKNELYFDGIIGLAGNDGSEPQTFTQILNNFGSLDNHQFSFYFPKNLSSQGELFIGGSNPSLYKNEVQWIQSPDAFWDIPSFNINLKGKTVINVPFKSGYTYIDTGTDVLMGPSSGIKILCSALGTNYNSNSGYCEISCSESSTVPNFSITFENGVTLEIDTQNNFIFPYSDNPSLCMLTIQDGGSKGEWALGLSVIRQFYTIWDFSKNQIGFASPI